MSLFRRTLLVVTAWLVAALGAVYLIADRVLFAGYENIERSYLRRTADRASTCVQGFVDERTGRLRDWSCWDDAYEFAQDQNRDFIDANLNDGSQDTAGNDAIWIADASGRVLWARMRTVEQCFDDMPDTVSDRIADLVTGLRYEDSAPTKLPPTRAGIVMIEDEAYVFAAQPILTSSRTGPSQGTIAFMRRFQPLADERLSSLLLFETRMLPTWEPVEMPQESTPGQGSQLTWISTSKSPMAWADLRDDDRAMTYVRLSTLDRSMGPTLEIQARREIVNHGRMTVGYFFAIVAVAGIVLAGVSLLGLHMLVLRRVIALSRDVEQVSTLGEGEGDKRVSEHGEDEIGGLSRRINRLLSVLGTQERNLRNRAEELEAARAVAVHADMIKTQFLANMSHEIRTPMTAVLGYADLLLDPGQDPATRTQHVQTIRRNAEHLLTLIDDILDVTKIEAGRMTIENVAFSPAQVCEEVHALLHARAAAKGVSLKTELGFPLPARINSDPTRLRQILVNLVGNAIKFTNEGGVLVHVTAVRHDGAYDLKFEVSDTGIGLTKEALERLFQPFVQADNSMTRRFGGTGLGLSISKRLAMMMGGDLTASSVEGAGSTFTFTLRLPETAETVWTTQRLATEPARAVARTPSYSLAGVTILLAEDGPDNQRLFEFHLRKAGAMVEMVDNGKAAAEAARAASERGKKFDLILMDMQMPVLDGYGATSLIRQQGYTGPIVALTAHAMAGDRERCIQAGCDDYLTKPIQRERLIEACYRWATGKAVTQRAA